MENFPTRRQHQMLPWATNLFTLVVMVAATWWSSAQRPTPGALELSSSATTVTAQKQKQASGQAAAVPAPTPVVTQVAWPLKTRSLHSGAVETVGFTTVRLR